jgi:site-specific DNA-cytosine methylase
VTGAPCQAFSSAGKKKGLGDTRGAVIFHSIAYIEAQRPRAVVVENVRNLERMRDSAGVKIINRICSILKKLHYKCDVRILNTLDHGVPQNRPRLYLVAVRKDVVVEGGDTTVFPWPEAIDHVSASKFLDMGYDSDSSRTPSTNAQKGVLGWALNEMAAASPPVCPTTSTVFVDIMAGPRFRQWQGEHCPCITRTRGGQGGFWVTCLGRKMTLQEIGAMQGIPRVLTQRLAQSGLSENKIGMAFGDAMSVNVLMRLFSRLLPHAGLAMKCHFADPWPCVSTKSRGVMPDAVLDTTQLCS